MEWIFSREELDLLEAYTVLGSTERAGLVEYLSFLLGRQYRRDALAAITGNQMLIQLLLNIRQFVERDEFDLAAAGQRINRLRTLYFELFASVHLKYSAVIPELDSYEIVRDFGLTGFDYMEQACRLGNKPVLRAEIEDFYRGFQALAQKNNKYKVRQLAAI
jgi:hypothetical protein